MNTAATPHVDLVIAPRAGWRAYLALMLVAGAILVARGVAISNAQSERFDDEAHLCRGVAFWQRSIGPRGLNDPTLGEGLTALPLVLSGSVPDDPTADAGLWGNRLSAEVLLAWIAVWKSILFLPFLALAFAWATQLYGPRAGWLTAALLLIEPTFAAHVPLPTIDVLAVEGIVGACFVISLYARRPTLGRLLAMCAAIGVAMSVKHTAVILPGVAILVSFAWWASGPRADRPAFRRVAGHVAIATIAVPLVIWALTLFDVSRPVTTTASVGPAFVRRLLSVPWPAGTYVRAFAQGAWHGVSGHGAFLNGVTRMHGWWDYYLIVATYKLPLGIAAILVVGLASFAWRRLSRDEWPLVIPAALWVTFLLANNINIGFRHFLPALAFLLILASRVAMTRSRVALGAIASALICATVEVCAAHPNYLSFINLARSGGKPYLAISDSNLDWGQGLVQLREWAARQPGDRPIRLAYFGEVRPAMLEHYLGGTRVEVIVKPPFRAMPASLPTRGLFVVSPSCLAGVASLRPLWPFDPRETIGGGSLLVYDLDAIGDRLRWTTMPSTTTAPADQRP